MATFYLSLSTKKDVNEQHQIMMRFSHGKVNQRAGTNIFVQQKYWDEAKEEIIVPNSRVMDIERTQTKNYLIEQAGRLNTLKTIVQESFNKIGKDNIKAQWLKDVIKKYCFPESFSTSNKDTTLNFFELFDAYLSKCSFAEVTGKNYLVLKRALQRYELIVANETSNFKLDVNTIDLEIITDFEDFLRNEHTLYDDYRSIYKQLPAVTGGNRKANKPQPRGRNTINSLFNKLRAFFNWCYDNDITANRPFKNYKSKPDLYGTPIYITSAERNIIYQTDLSQRPKLAIQRDIFVFQCLIGCRVSDLLKMTKSNVMDDGFIEYIPRKTKDGHPETLRVPLIETANEIIERYRSNNKQLLPFISPQKYNEAIKEIFKFAGITRIVTVINPTTEEQEQKPINEIASSHMARRTFVGNMYKQTKDPNLVGSVSGHKEGSKSFARYREIDDDMKIELLRTLIK
ncbi:site-specific integrase [Parabacteroides sp. OttesenSCG-928-G21]|nr:site-specific integrase [Parabacteroides sp. OttesenSCG-928-G21]